MPWDTEKCPQHCLLRSLSWLSQRWEPRPLQVSPAPGFTCARPDMIWFESLCYLMTCLLIRIFRFVFL